MLVFTILLVQLLDSPAKRRLMLCVIAAAVLLSPDADPGGAPSGHAADVAPRSTCPAEGTCSAGTTASDPGGASVAGFESAEPS